MKIAEVSARPPQLVQQLVEVWQRSVQATHLFLSAPEIAAIRTYVPQALCGVEHLIFLPLCSAFVIFSTSLIGSRSFKKKNLK